MYRDNTAEPLSLRPSPEPKLPKQLVSLSATLALLPFKSRLIV